MDEVGVPVIPTTYSGLIPPPVPKVSVQLYWSKLTTLAARSTRMVTFYT